MTFQGTLGEHQFQIPQAGPGGIPSTFQKA